MWKEVAALFKALYPGMCLKGLRKCTKNLSQDSRSQDQYLNPGPPKYETGCSSLDHGVRYGKV
jgi:hypothetical protein